MTEIRKDDKEYRVEVIADSSGKWCGNGLSFDTVSEAKTYALDLYSRWVLVEKWRVVNKSETVQIQG